MFNKSFSAGPFKTFYFVFAYVMAFAFWWTFLLYQKNETAYKEKIELNELNYVRINPGSKYSQSEEYAEISAKYKRQKLMIITESTAFISLLLLGLWRVRKVFLQELALAAQQRNFLHSITHELKSPLSSIKLSLQTISKRKLEAEQSEKLISNSLSDLDRFEALVDNILLAAKVEREDAVPSQEEINASEIATSVADKLSYNKKNIEIIQQIAADVHLHADKLGFTSVIINLLENAIKYSPPNTKVKISVAEDDALIYIVVSDNGIGIAQQEKQKIFSKFYRIGNENTRNTKGTGLGLYIVKRFIEIYGGKIEVNDNMPNGSIFQIHLPKTSA